MTDSRIPQSDLQDEIQNLENKYWYSTHKIICAQLEGDKSEAQREFCNFLRLMSVDLLERARTVLSKRDESISKNNERAFFAPAVEIAILLYDSRLQEFLKTYRFETPNEYPTVYARAQRCPIDANLLLSYGDDQKRLPPFRDMISTLKKGKLRN